MQEHVQISSKRLMRTFECMSQFGLNEDGGIDRSFASPADRKTRQWILQQWQSMGLKTHVDPVANLWGSMEGEEKLPPIVIGSHHDAVPDGGKYDGAMGVLIATEVAKTIRENSIHLRHPLSVISFTAEEPNTFNLSTLGSKVLCGRLKQEDLFPVRDRSGNVKLVDALRELGGDPNRIDEARIKPGEISCFLEVHNEMGRQLECRNLAISGVSVITGIYRERIQVLGESNHAGTTMMKDRKDAFLALGELALSLERAAKARCSPNVTATMGCETIKPNETNIIPGMADGVIDIRTSDPDDLNALLRALENTAEELLERRHVRIDRTCILNQKAQPMDSRVQEAIRKGILAMDEPAVTVVSMAGHDAANMQRIAPAGMIFVRSVGGYGHCRMEYCREEDMVKAANALLETILILDQQMEVEV